MKTVKPSVRRELYKILVAEVLVILGMILTSTAYYVSQVSLHLPEAESLQISGVKIHKRPLVLTGVYVANADGEAVSLSKVYLIKVESKKVIFSVSFFPYLKLPPREIRFLSFTCPLDPRGADYKVIVVTEEEKAAKYVFGYPPKRGGAFGSREAEIGYVPATTYALFEEEGLG
ncbi:MAG: hypothetical protein ACXQTF_01100 [Candidatus Hecatellaceae archaeon]|nr:MAG: hypothetical protein DRO43_04790 [Candidatus Hecatellales archaeon]